MTNEPDPKRIAEDINRVLRYLHENPKEHHPMDGIGEETAMGPGAADQMKQIGFLMLKASDFAERGYDYAAYEILEAVGQFFKAMIEAGDVAADIVKRLQDDKPLN